MTIYLCAQEADLGLYIEADSAADALAAFTELIPVEEALCDSYGKAAACDDPTSVPEGQHPEFRVTRDADGGLHVEDLRSQPRTAHVEMSRALLDLYADYVETFGVLSGADFVDRVGNRMRETIAPLLRRLGYDWVQTPEELDRGMARHVSVPRQMAQRRQDWERTHRRAHSTARRLPSE